MDSYTADACMIMQLCHLDLKLNEIMKFNHRPWAALYGYSDTTS